MSRSPFLPTARNFDGDRLNRNFAEIKRGMASALSANDNASITGEWTFVGDTDITGLLTISGDTEITGILSVSGAATITGDATVAGLTLTANVLPDVNDTHDIGSSSLKLANVYATTFRGTATSALYADLAERYAADAVYQPGTVMVIAGDAEITQSTAPHDIRVIGIISTAPALMMNSEAGDDATHPFIALVGRVPCKVVGRVLKGDLLVTSWAPGHAMRAGAKPVTGSVVGRALEDHEDDGSGVIEVAVSRG